MGLLIEGHWHDQWYESSKDGAFQREQAQRRHWLTAVPGRVAKEALPPKRAAITYMCRWRAPGPIAP